MANYYGYSRSNYFHIRAGKEEQLKKLISACACDEDALELWVETDSDGKPIYGFGANDAILGLPEKWTYEYDPRNDDEVEDYDYDYDLFIDELQKLIKPGDACIITEVGHEKLRYLAAYSMVITSKKISYVDLADAAKKRAKMLLHKRDWATKNEY